MHIKRIVLACYEARLKFQNVVLTGGPLYLFKCQEAYLIKEIS